MSLRVLYVEVPGFYAAVERAARPDLAGRPVVVGGNPRKGGVVQAATPDAAVRGVEPGMPVLEALECCPEARALPTRMPAYREAGVRFAALLRRLCGPIEEAGLGAAYAETRPGDDARALAAQVEEAVGAELHLAARIGIAPVKFVARVAAEQVGAQGIREVGPEDLESFLHPLPVLRLSGVGANTETLLARRGVRTIGELVALGRAELARILGARGEELFDLALGRDPAPVRATRHAKSLSQEVTLPSPQVDRGVLEAHLESLAESLARRLALERLGARRVSLKLRFDDQRTATRRHTLGAPVSEAPAIHAVALALLRRTQAGARPVRLVGLALSELGPAARDERQLELFPRSP